jgi:dihydroflavonol-4-reductase
MVGSNKAAIGASAGERRARTRLEIRGAIGLAAKPMSLTGKALVTGASGFVGSAVARLLVERGFSVRALVRGSSPQHQLAGVDIEFVRGDLRHTESVRQAIAGVRWVFHVAADYRLWARNPAEIVENNVLSTRIVMEEAQRADVERIVYTSSVATLKTGPTGDPSDETISLEEHRAIGNYKLSKVLAERLVLTMAERGLPVTIVNPSTPIGPRDVKPTPTGRFIVEAAAGRVPAFVETGLNMVHVDDVAAGHLAALERGRVGERYILGGQNASLSEILMTIAQQTGRRSPRLKVPRAVVFPIAVMAEAIARGTGREPFVTVDALRMSKHRMYFTAAKAERELGFRARPYAEGIRDAIEWFRKTGRLSARAG